MIKNTCITGLSSMTSARAIAASAPNLVLCIPRLSSERFC